jgi:hypothetical protein
LLTRPLEIFDQLYYWVSVDRFGCRNASALAFCAIISSVKKGGSGEMDPVDAEEPLEGKIGRVSEAILPNGEMGEVMLAVRGTSEGFNAVSKGEGLIPKNTQVVVVEQISSRTVLVTALR